MSQGEPTLSEFSEVASLNIVHKPAGTLNVVLIDPTSEIVSRRE